MEALGINLGFLIMQIVNFLLIFLLLRALVWRPLVNMLEERREKIEKGLEDARIAAEARDNAEKDAEAIRAEARAEAQKILTDARARGEDIEKELSAEASEKAEQIRADAREDAEAEREQLLADMRSQVIELAIAAANHLIGETIDEKAQQEIVNNFFASVPEGAKGLGGNIEVVSALTLTDAEQKKIQDITGASDVNYKVNPDILGGLVIRSGERVIDGSVRTSLMSMKARMN